MRKVACWAVDGNPRYWQSLKLALFLFGELHHGWVRRVYMVRYDEAKADFLRGQGVEVVDSERLLALPNGGECIYIPTARVRCHMLEEVLAAGDFFAYFDADGFVVSPVEPLVEELLLSGKQFALFEESDPRFHRTLIREGFHAGKIPEAWFPDRELWQDNPMINSGMILAHGPDALKAGVLAREAYPDCEPYLRFGEQGVIGAAVFETRLPWRKLHTHEHCSQFEHHVRHSGRPYIDQSTIDGGRVIFRHFCAVENKQALFVRTKQLSAYYGLK